jgi:hypothetical protein
MKLVRPEHVTIWAKLLCKLLTIIMYSFHLPRQVCICLEMLMLLYLQSHNLRAVEIVFTVLWSKYLFHLRCHLNHVLDHASDIVHKWAKYSCCDTHLSTVFSTLKWNISQSLLIVILWCFIKWRGCLWSNYVKRWLGMVYWEG